MSIYHHSYPHPRDISRGLQEVLRKNGMQAHISMTPQGGHQLIVLGHDSPALTYQLSDQQAQDLMTWGMNSENKRAYETFTSIVKNDFHVPQNFVSAKNAFGRVAIGLHGYRVGMMGTGRPHASFHRHLFGWGGDFIGWAPRFQAGWHMRRIGDRPFVLGTSMVPERWDGSLRPGELKSGGYGFYYKGHQTETAQEVLDDLSVTFDPLEAAPRPQGQGVPYSEAITSDVYFTNEKFQEVLSSHGIIIDPEKKTMTIMSSAAKVDLQYELSDEEVHQLTAANINGSDGVSVAKRLDIINKVIALDFDTKIDKQMLESKELVNIELKPDVKEELEAPFKGQKKQLTEQERQPTEQEVPPLTPFYQVDGRDLQYLNESKGFYREGKHGREVSVESIKVNSLGDGKYKMTAVIDGQAITHEISQKDHDKFLAVDDYHRMKLFSKIFTEVDMKTRPGMGANIGAAILAAMVVTSDVLTAGRLMHPHPRLDIYETHIGGGVYHKPGVVHPAEVAAASFEQGEQMLHKPSLSESVGRSI